MAIRDMLLTLTSYPDATPLSVIHRAVSFASALDAHLATISRAHQSIRNDCNQLLSTLLNEPRCC